MKFIDFSKIESNNSFDKIPDRTGDIKRVHIKDKLNELGVNWKDLKLGDFDQIGEVTAKKKRDPSSELYKSVGAFFRPNYERGILIYSLIKHYNIKSFLEIGFGRGYGTMCAALAMSENGGGKIVSIDPNFDQDFLNQLGQLFPQQWFKMIQFVQGKSQDYLPTTEEKFDFIYIDGDHTYAATKRDWELCKDRYNKILLFDDYHLPGKVQKDIECSNLIDQIEDESKELIIQDRRIFLDDRGYTDDQIDYGQVLLTRPEK
jgi:predicted O-methyltransferase YrrM